MDCSPTKNKTICCRAAVCWSPLNQTIDIIEVSAPKTGEVRVRVTACGICGSDNHIYRANDERASFVKWPIILGHEAGGIVESVGDGVSSVSEGDSVALLYMPQCGECELCVGNDTSFCMKGTGDGNVNKWAMSDGTTRLTHKGNPVYKYLSIGAFAEYVVLPEQQVAKIPKHVDIVKFCLFSCGIATGFGTSINVVNIKTNHVVAIWGLGTVGLSAVLGAKQMNAKQIIGIDTNESKFELALKFGCTRVINPDKLTQAVHQLLQNDYNGVDIGIECVGSIPIIDTIIKSVKPWGTVCLVGITPMQCISVLPISFINGLKLIGSNFGGFRGKDSVKYFLEKYEDQSFPINDFITKTIELEELNSGLDLLKQGNAIKIVVKI